MRAAVLPAIPSMLEVREVDVDKPHRREVLVRTVAADLCHSDLHFLEGKYSHVKCRGPAPGRINVRGQHRDGHGRIAAHSRPMRIHPDKCTHTHLEKRQAV